MIEDVLHRESSPFISWSRVNIAETAAGVHTPLSWCVWEAGEVSNRRAYTRLFLMPHKEPKAPHPADRKFASAFYGRGANNMDMYGWALSALPGNTGTAAKEGYFASETVQKTSASALRRAVVRLWIPIYMVGFAGRLRRLRRHSAESWARGIAALPNADLSRARNIFSAGIRRFTDELTSQIALSTGVVSQLSSALQALTRQAGRSDLLLAVVSGYGETEEMGMTAELQAVARGQLPEEQFLARHGFHGPATGELSSHSWREDPEALTPLLRTLAAATKGRERGTAEHELRSGRGEAEAAILAGLPRMRRPWARTVFACARVFMPLRTTTKAAFTQSFDLIRAAARRLGEIWVADGTLERPDDVFYLSVAEIFELPAEPRATVAFRRAKRAEYQKLELPLSWTGMPVPSVSHVCAGEAGELREVDDGAGAGADADADASKILGGLGVSGGVAEGIARVFSDSSHLNEMEDGAVLVCSETDPSWAATMLLASALVIDIGGLLSHGAIVARELGIPCVINTVNGTRRLRSGDRVRVDGDLGIVTVLDPRG